MMRVKVRAIEPRVDEPGLEELVVELEAPARRTAARPPTDPAIPNPVMTDLAPAEPAPDEPPVGGPVHELPARGPGHDTIALASSGHDPSSAAGAQPVARVVLARRPLRAADLGPNGDVVLDLIDRASRLTPEERKALEKEAAWRWWMLTPFAWSTMPAARARALVRGRADGRADAIVALEAAVAAIVDHLADGKAGRSRLPAAIANAGLAVLVRDLIEPEDFEILFGPWREVMHH